MRRFRQWLSYRCDALANWLLDLSDEDWQAAQDFARQQAEGGCVVMVGDTLHVLDFETGIARPVTVQ